MGSILLPSHIEDGVKLRAVDWPHGLRCSRTGRELRPGDMITMVHDGWVGDSVEIHRVEVIALDAYVAGREFGFPTLGQLVITYEDAEGLWRWRRLANGAVVTESERGFESIYREISIGPASMRSVARHGRDLALDDAAAFPGMLSSCPQPNRRAAA